MTDNDTLTAGRTYVPAGFLRRLGALFYDLLLTIAVLFAATAVALTATRNHLDPSALWFRLYVLGAVFVFFGWFWTHGGQTTGMRAWGIRVESIDGAPVQWWQALIRFVVVIGSLGVGLLWTLVDSHKQGIHDHLAKTRVVRT